MVTLEMPLAPKRQQQQAAKKRFPLFRTFQPDEPTGHNSQGATYQISLVAWLPLKSVPSWKDCIGRWFCGIQPVCRDVDNDANANGGFFKVATCLYHTLTANFSTINPPRLVGQC